MGPVMSGNSEPAVAPTWLLEKVITPRVMASTRITAPSRNPSYVDAAVASELQKLVGTRTNRNNQLNDSAMAIGSLIGKDLPRCEAEERLFGAAVANSYVAKDGEAAARATIKS